MQTELSLLRPGQLALRDGRPQVALAAFDAHRQQCPHGTLTEEREAARIVALCALHRDGDATTAIAQFRREAPRSPQLSRIANACGALADEPHR